MVAVDGGEVRTLGARVDGWVERLRARRGWALLAVNLRLFIGFALLPSGLKKVLGEPFTDPANTGAFHDFLDAFHATGSFYTWVGVMQLGTALLLMTQRHATAGAALALPIFTTILVFCWSTGVVFTASVVTLIVLGVTFLLLWDLRAWRGLLAPTFGAGREATTTPVSASPVDLGLWARCGVGVLMLYAAACLLQGGIYRPRGVELDNPAFYLFPVMLLLPIATWLVDRGRYRRGRRGVSSPG